MITQEEAEEIGIYVSGKKPEDKKGATKLLEANDEMEEIKKDIKKLKKEVKEITWHIHSV